MTDYDTRFSDMRPHQQPPDYANPETQGRKLSDLGMLASRLAHEVRNPLNAMRLQAAVIEKKLAKGEAKDLEVARQQLEALRGEIARLEKLVESFLVYGRPPKPEPERIELPRFLEDLVEFVKRDGQAHGINVSLNVNGDASASRVYMDRAQLEQVLLNLIKNANRAMERGGDLTLEIRAYGDERVGITVADNGVGIPPENLESIFDPFVSTRSDGSGLGLPITRQIVEAAGGCIRVESEVGRGSRFEILLPMGGPPSAE